MLDTFAVSFWFRLVLSFLQQCVHLQPFCSLLVNHCCDIAIPGKTLISAEMITSAMQTHNTSGLPWILCVCCVHLPSRAVNKLQAAPGCNPLLTTVSSCAVYGPKRAQDAVHSVVHLVMS